MKTVDELMALADEFTEYSRGIGHDEVRTALHTAIEQALAEAREEALTAANRMVRAAIRLEEQAQPEPVAWIQPDHLQKARVAPFLCRVEPTKRMSDFIPIYTEQVTHGLQMECPASATDDSGSADGVGARCVDAAVMEHAARPLKAEPAPEALTDAQVYEIWERAAQIDLSGRVNELIRTKDAQCVIRAILKAQKEKT